MKQKLYCYVDETGQDTKGLLFIVSVVVVQKDREKISSILEKIEQITGKNKTKWMSTKKKLKIAYLENVLTNKLLRSKIFYSISKETKAYKEITLLTIASSVTASKKNDMYEALVFIRLADAIAGMIREHEEGIDYAKKLYMLGMKNKTVTNL